MPVCSDIQMDLQVNEILIILVQLLQNGHLYFFENICTSTEKCKIKYHCTLDHDVDYYD